MLKDSFFSKRRNLERDEASERVRKKGAMKVPEGVRRTPLSTEILNSV